MRFLPCALLRARCVAGRHPAVIPVSIVGNNRSEDAYCNYPKTQNDRDPEDGEDFEDRPLVGVPLGVTFEAQTYLSLGG